MKLLLTSAGWEENHKISDEFLRLIGKPIEEVRILAVITPDKFYKRNKYILRAMKIGIKNSNTTFFQLDRKIKNTDLKNKDAVFIFGGNTFEYLDRIRKTGFEKEIKKFVKKGGVYVGFSAGSYVACPDIKHAYWKNSDRNLIGLKNLKGLNLIPFIIKAHFEKKYETMIGQLSKETKLPVFALTDKQAISINGKIIKIIGGGEKINTFNLNKNLLKRDIVNLVIKK